MDFFRTENRDCKQCLGFFYVNNLLQNEKNRYSLYQEIIRIS